MTAGPSVRKAGCAQSLGPVRLAKSGTADTLLFEMSIATGEQQ
ncbi:hypothetical protein [Halosimplex halobium]